MLKHMTSTRARKKPGTKLIIVGALLVPVMFILAFIGALFGIDAGIWLIEPSIVVAAGLVVVGFAWRLLYAIENRPGS